MKKTKTLYWVITGLFGAFMVFTSIPDVLMVKDAVTFMNHLGYPPYFTLFIGVAKILGVIGILVSGYPRVREWAYAGLCFDLVGAAYSQVATDGMQAGELFMVLPIGLLALSYSLSHRKERVAAALATA